MLPKRKGNSKSDPCKCTRTTTKGRRREWKSNVQNMSQEFRLEQNTIQCLRLPKVNPKGPCSLYDPGTTLKEIKTLRPSKVVRVSQTPIQGPFDVTYLRYAELAKKIGALNAVKACCAFCNCPHCCACYPGEYDFEEPVYRRKEKTDMRSFDQRIKNDFKILRIVYQ